MARGERCGNEEDNSPDLDQYTKDALDQLFNKEQQTYDQFLQGFTFLTKEDVIKQKSHSPQIIVPQIGEKHKEKKDFVVVSTSTEEPQQLNNDNHFIEGNDLPEEVLGPGLASGSILMEAAGWPRTEQSMLQVDNFVDCEDETSDNEDRTLSEVDAILEDGFLCGNYLPSVASTSLCSSTSKHDSGANCTKMEDLEDCNADFSKEELDAREICYLSERVSNLPGEVDEWGCHVEQVHDHSSKESAKPHLRQLQISTRTNQSGQRGNSHVTESQDADEVTTFQLDTEFDYDNVSLTPKYSFPIKNLDSLELH